MTGARLSGSAYFFEVLIGVSLVNLWPVLLVFLAKDRKPMEAREWLVLAIGLMGHFFAVTGLVATLSNKP